MKAWHHELPLSYYCNILFFNMLEDLVEGSKKKKQFTLGLTLQYYILNKTTYPQQEGKYQRKKENIIGK